ENAARLGQERGPPLGDEQLGAEHLLAVHARRVVRMAAPLLRSALLRQVARDDNEALVLERLDHFLDPDDAGIAAAPPPFLRELSLVACRLEHARDVAGTVLRAEHAVGLSARLHLRVAGKPLRTLVPAGDDAVAVEREDGMAADRVEHQV